MSQAPRQRTVREKAGVSHEKVINELRAIQLLEDRGVELSRRQRRVKAALERKLQKKVQVV